jgi:hypothetical protein
MALARTAPPGPDGDPWPDPVDDEVLATVNADDYPTRSVSWIMRQLVGQPARLETFLNDLDRALEDCRIGTADLDDVLTLLAYWVTILKLQHVHV